MQLTLAYLCNTGYFPIVRSTNQQFNLICNLNFLLPFKVTCSQFLRIRMWTSWKAIIHPTRRVNMATYTNTKKKCTQRDLEFFAQILSMSGIHCLHLRKLLKFSELQFLLHYIKRMLTTMKVFEAQANMEAKGMKRGVSLWYTEERMPYPKECKYQHFVKYSS